MFASRLANRLLCTLVVISLLLAACGPAPSTATPPPAAATAIVSAPTAPPTRAEMPATLPPATEPSAGVPTSQVLASHDLVFARFEEPAVEILPAIQHEPIAPDLGNVRVPFILSEAQRARLAQDGFVITPGAEKEFFTVYEQARYANVPVFVTSDSLLHTYHLLFDKVLRTAEVGYFIPLLRDLNAALLSRAQDEYEALQGTAWEEAARRTVAFVGVASKLLDPSVQIPDYAADLVEAELALVEEAASIQPSPLFPGLAFGEDYTQYIPRGHYTRSQDLEAYFRSMMWYGRMTFRLQTGDPDLDRAETRMALLLVHALRTADIAYRPALEAWADLYNPTAFFVGRSDDLTVLQYGEVMDRVYGSAVTVASLADDTLLDAFIEDAKELPPPRILGLVIMDTDDVEEQTKGLRFMGQRFVPDAYIFRQLIYRNVGTREQPRLLPKGLDLMAAMGSQRAYQIVDEMGETAYENYPEQMAKVQAWVSGLSVEEWTETLYNSWLYSFQPLLQVPGEGYPAFMQSPAWLDKQLHTTLGSWTELKHDTILYAKQVYAEHGDGPAAPEPLPPQGYVEPVPHFFARLAALTVMTRQGLSDRGLLDQQDDQSLRRLEELVSAFQVMAEKELRAEPLTEEEFALIRLYGVELEQLLRASVTTPDGGEPGGHGFFTEEDLQAAVVADVATNPGPPATVLEEAVGRVDEIHVVVPLVEEDGTFTLQVTKGGVFSYYEFPWPAEDRLTDDAWRQMLDQGQAPPRPEWISSFWTTEGEDSELTRVVFSFQKTLGEALWSLEPSYLWARSAAQQQVSASIEDLRAAKQYEGHQLVHSDFRSFDRQAENLAVVTVRETWQDWLYEFNEYPGYAGMEPGEPDQPLAQRGPYTLDATYTLERDDTGWGVTRVVYADEPPAW
jgi:hypothetical protein